MKSKLFLTLLIAALSSASLSGALISANSDGIMQFPVFHVYASDSDVEADESNVPKANTNWEFKKSLDFQSEPHLVQVEGPGETSLKVQTPNIKVYLVNADTNTD